MYKHNKFNLLVTLWAIALISAPLVFSNVVLASPSSPIIFVGQVPQTDTFATATAPFSNHLASMKSAPRGGGLFIRYPDGSIKNLTAAAGYGEVGEQGRDAIAVRDPSVHWSGSKALFSMVVGAPDHFEVTTYRWQLYEVRGLGKNETPHIQKVGFQPSEYNNISPFYGLREGEVYFVSDTPFAGMKHLYPQLGERESAPSTSGLWKIDAASKSYFNISYFPSGLYEPFIDSRGKVVFTKAAYLQQDPQAVTNEYGAFNYSDESASAFNTGQKPESFPEALNISNPVDSFEFSYLFPWEITLRGTGLSSLHGIGRHELLKYFESAPSNDPNLTFFRNDLSSRASQNFLNNVLHINESPTESGAYYGTNARPYDTHAAGQIVKLMPTPNDPGGLALEYITHPDTAEYTGTPSTNHSGLYRDPLALSNGEVVAAHTANTASNENFGTAANPIPAYNFRLRTLSPVGAVYTAGVPLTNGIEVDVSYFDPDIKVSYKGNLWELQPVEVLTRPRPGEAKTTLQAPERAVFANENVNIDEFTQYLRDNNLGLVVLRDATSRDGEDKQQPYNLQVAGVNRSTIATSGQVYTLSALQILQADFLRGYTNPRSQNSTTAEELLGGRRVLPVAMHSVKENPLAAAQAGSFFIQSDSSVAALVPADRPITWQLLDQHGQAVVRERYWFNVKAGEITACGGCHPAGGANQVGAPEPDNQALALKKVLRWWKGEPLEVAAEYGLAVSGTRKRKKITAQSFKAKKVFTRRQFKIDVTAQAGDAGFQDLELHLAINKKQCPSPIAQFQSDKDGAQVLFGKAPNMPRRRAKLTFEIMHNGSPVASAKGRLIRRGFPKSKQRRLRSKKIKRLCKKMAVQ